MIPTDKIELTNLRHPAMRTFHVSWSAFFVCFLGWFGVAPFMPLIREEMSLSGEQVGNLIIASVAMTVFARIVVGRVCDRWGPRRTYSALLLIGAFPVMGMGLAHNYETLLVFRLLVGFVGASFVVTQVHMSGLFSARVVGTANATSAGWGNLGAGGSQIVMNQDRLDAVLRSVRSAVDSAAAANRPAVLVCAPALRPAIRRLVGAQPGSVPVLSYREVTSANVRIETVGVVRHAEPLSA